MAGTTVSRHPFPSATLHSQAQAGIGGRYTPSATQASHDWNGDIDRSAATRLSTVDGSLPVKALVRAVRAVARSLSVGSRTVSVAARLYADPGSGGQDVEHDGASVGLLGIGGVQVDQGTYEVADSRRIEGSRWRSGSPVPRLALWHEMGNVRPSQTTADLGSVGWQAVGGASFHDRRDVTAGPS